MNKRISSVLAGIVVGFAIVFAGDWISHFIYPMPASMDLNDPDSIRAVMAAVPRGVLVLMLGYWLLSSFAGGFVAGKINREGWKRSSIFTGSILLAGAIGNFFMIPHPAWMIVASLILYIPCAYLGGKLAS